jgi:uncharacterized protein YcfL
MPRPTSTNTAFLLSLMALLLILVSGCSSSPEDLADEMCDCVTDDGTIACVSLSQEHMNTLGDDREALVTYRQAVAQCR